MVSSVMPLTAKRARPKYDTPDKKEPPFPAAFES
jgi:hypothetical protein